MEHNGRPDDPHEIHTLSCSGCGRALMRVMVRPAPDPVAWRVRARCGWCHDHSLPRTFRGRIAAAPTERNDRPLTVVSPGEYDPASHSVTFLTRPL